MRRSEHPEPSIGFCAVCSDRADGYHYGVLSCRGCNAFFRRAIAFNLQFHCRREGHCEINKNARCACRACRLKKCRDVGMDPCAVQIKREVKELLGLHNHHQPQPPHFSHHSQQEFTFGPNSSSSGSHHLHTISALPAVVFGSAKVLDSPPMKSRLLGSMTSSMAHSPLVQHPLDRLVEWYLCQRYRRASMLCQTVEALLGAMCSNGHNQLEMQQQPVQMATPEDLIQVNKVQMVLMFEWAEQLEQFEQQLEEPLDKTLLLRAFALKYLVLDTVMHTLEQGCCTADTGEQQHRIVLPNGSCIQRQRAGGTSDFLHPMYGGGGSSSQNSNGYSSGGGGDEDERRRWAAMEMMYGDEHLALVEELIQPLADFEVTFGQFRLQGEFMALRLLLFWDPQEARNRSIRPQFAEVIRCASDRAIADLQSWYDEQQQNPALLAMENGSNSRLEHLLHFLPIIKKFAAHLSKITAQIPDFAVMSEWQFIADLLKGTNS